MDPGLGQGADSPLACALLHGALALATGAADHLLLEHIGDDAMTLG